MRSSLYIHRFFAEQVSFILFLFLNYQIVTLFLEKITDFSIVRIKPFRLVFVYLMRNKV